MKVYRYWCEPISQEDNDRLCGQIRLAAQHRRELALIENRARAQIEKWAVDMCRAYGTVAIERFALPPLVRRDNNDDDEPERRLRRLNARRVQIVGPGTVRAALKRFAVKYGSRIVQVPAAYTTRTCAECGHRRDDVLDWSSLTIECSACGRTEDQDRTAARNLRASGEVRREDAEPLASSKIAISRTRRNRKRSREEVALANVDVSNERR
jgi:transposase